MVSIQIPDSLYHRLERVAEISRRPLEEVVTQALESGVPPMPDNLPEGMRPELLALEKSSDDELWQIFRSTVSPERAEQHQRLLEKNSSDTITEEERATLAQFRQEADRLMLRKAYAAVLLKWRGHRLPTLAELEAQA